MAALAKSAAAASLPASLGGAPSHPAAASSLPASNGAAASLPPRAPTPAAASLPARRRRLRRPPIPVPVGATEEEASLQIRTLEEAEADVVKRLESLRDLVGLYIDDIKRELNQLMQVIVPPPTVIPQGSLMITVKTADGKVVYVYNVAAGKWVRDGEDGEGALGSWSEVVRELTAIVAKYTAGGGN